MATATKMLGANGVQLLSIEVQDLICGDLTANGDVIVGVIYVPHDSDAKVYVDYMFGGVGVYRPGERITIHDDRD